MLSQVVSIGRSFNGDSLSYLCVGAVDLKGFDNKVILSLNFIFSRNPLSNFNFLPLTEYWKRFFISSLPRSSSCSLLFVNGLVFLDKIFQLVVELPDISAIQKRIYWNKLLNISNPDEPKVTKVEVNEIKRKVESAPHNSDKMDIANNTEGSVEKKQIAREQAISSVSIREDEKCEYSGL